MSEQWENIVTGNDLIKAKRERKRDYIFEKFHIDTRSSMEKQGWEYISTYKRGDLIRMKMAKPFGEIFENKVWLMFCSMGFTHMNRDNSFVIPYDKNSPTLTKQIDVFAADEETVLVVECKATKVQDTARDFQKDINEFNGIKDGLYKAIQSKYPKRKIKFIWAISNKKNRRPR